MLSFEATAVSTSDTGLAVRARDFEWVVDEPAALGGGDLGPNPVEYTLGSLLGCLNVVVHLVAKERGVTLSSFSAKATGELDPARFMGKSMEARAGYQSIHVTIEVTGDATDEELAEIARISEARCPVSDNIAHETPVSISIVKQVAVEV
ncbi:OsmC family protein [Demequina zhanjiangensis]|uniref:OsmC family protein n=1 Tax=Demequina zhanjiangensis TaxID=3051659 RepID=A0ABT8G2I2_9MICO|nr:OsmC family protein [Demequina sp. SYSU T00b26]MDN4473356.1 OsmC family protein [Demequina sp. SYSU T00b26]